MFPTQCDSLSISVKNTVSDDGGGMGAALDHTEMTGQPTSQTQELRIPKHIWLWEANHHGPAFQKFLVTDVDSQFLRLLFCPKPGLFWSDFDNNLFETIISDLTHQPVSSFETLD